MAINTSDRQSALAASIKLNLYFHSDSGICFSFLSAIVEAVDNEAGVGRRCRGTACILMTVIIVPLPSKQSMYVRQSNKKRRKRGLSHKLIPRITNPKSQRQPKMRTEIPLLPLTLVRAFQTLRWRGRATVGKGRSS